MNEIFLCYDKAQIIKHKKGFSQAIEKTPSTLKILKADSHLPPQKLFYCLQWTPPKYDEKCLLFHRKSSFCSQNIYSFALTFWRCRKSGLIREIIWISKFMTSQPGWKIIQCTYCSICHKNFNKKMEFGQVI